LNLFSALALLFAAGIKNRIRRTLRRMRQPRFLIATVVGLLYFWQFLFRRWVMLTRPLPDSPLRELALGDLRPLAEAALISLALFQILGAWVFGDERAQLAFTEAEVQFFFPAPASRSALVHYKLARGTLWLIVAAVLSAAFIGRAVSHHPALFTAGAWLALTLTFLHRVAASFTRDRLAALGRWARVLVWAGLAAFGALALVGFRSAWADVPLPRTGDGWIWAASFTEHVLTVPPFGWVLWPLRMLVRPMLTQSQGDFLAALPAAVGLVALHYLWAVLAVAPFEEASAAAAELRGRWLESRRTRSASPKSIKLRRAPWALLGVGRPEVALTWKNGIAFLRQFRAGPILVLAALGAFLLALSGRSPDGATVRLVMAAGGLGLLVLVGPARLGLDLRHDVERMDILRALPLRGRDIVFSEMLTPAVVLVVLEWVLVGLALASGGTIEDLGWDARVGIACGAALVAPALTVLSLVMQNAAALLFPDWMAVFRERRRGFEAMGQRLLTMIGTTVVMAFGAVPATIAGGLVLWPLWSSLHWAAVPLGAGVACIALLAEAFAGVGWVGRLFETHDVSAP
jgi:ABC-2 type transport system permease protein